MKQWGPQLLRSCKLFRQKNTESFWEEYFKATTKKQTAVNSFLKKIFNRLNFRVSSGFTIEFTRHFSHREHATSTTRTIKAKLKQNCLLTKQRFGTKL